MKYVIITHKDLDGIAGASLFTYCRRVNSDQLKIIFTEPSNLLKFLRKYYKKGRYLVIIDIGLNRAIHNELKDLDLSDVHIEWYDHHVWDQEWIKVLQDKRIDLYIDRSTCATGVVARNVCSDREMKVKYLVERVCDVDLWRFNTYESTFLFRYADLENSNRWRNKVFNLIKYFLEGGIEDIVSGIEEDVSKYVDEELRILSTLRSRIIKKDVEDLSLCIYFKEKSIPSTSIIGNAMLSICDIAVVIHESLKSLSFRSRKCNVREIAKIFNGGGHPRAAGAPLNIPFIYRVLSNISLDVVRKDIVEQILNRIESFKPHFKSLCTEE
jgi:oligoribonuclease NrnB/cAMP/cGMP phosphodiesterase (DHH superfamily)